MAVGSHAMTYAYLVAASIVFVELLMRLDLKRQALRIAACSREALAVMASAETDAVKEAHMRRASVDVLRATLALGAKVAAIGAALAAPWWLVSAAAPELGDSILDKAVSPSVLVALTVTAAAYAWLRHVVLEQL